MKFDKIIKNPIFRKALGYMGIAIAGVAAMANELSDQKKKKEFEELKEAVSELQKNK